jgi:hypothetical protein
MDPGDPSEDAVNWWEEPKPAPLLAAVVRTLAILSPLLCAMAYGLARAAAWQAGR